MKDFLQFILDKILDDASGVKIEETVSEYNEQVYNIISPKDKIAYLIGREGRVIQAIRNVAKILAVKEKLKIRINISEASEV